jgi:uncharacterized protein YcfJ
LFFSPSNSSAEVLSSTVGLCSSIEPPYSCNLNELASNPYSVRAIVLDHYKSVVKQVPYDVEVCKRVHQGTGDGSATNEIIGAIFGGVIGNQFGEGDGKDAMTLAGIILGASLAHDDELTQGPGVLTTKCYIETRYSKSVQSRVYSHSTLTFTIKGKNYKFDFIK